MKTGVARDELPKADKLKGDDLLMIRIADTDPEYRTRNIIVDELVEYVMDKIASKAVGTTLKKMAEDSDEFYRAMKYMGPE